MGTSLVEVLTALVLTALVLQGAWALASSARRTGRLLLERSEALETERVGWHVLLTEVSAGVAVRDWHVEQKGVLPLRVFRGLAQLCPGRVSDSQGLVRYRGIRAPDPDKDSLLVLGEDGAWRVVKLLGVGAAPEEEGASGCDSVVDAPLEWWSWDPPVREPVLARVFERGSYHLENGAVRYRRGAAGRQPLTPERVDEEGSAFLEPFPGSLQLRLRVRVGDGVTREWTRALSRPDDGG